MLDGPARLATAAAQVAAKRRAATAVGSSAALRAVLVATLDMGNFLNHGGRGGQAAGYQLETLLRLGDTRAPSDPKTTLLHFLAAACGAATASSGTEPAASSGSGGGARTALAQELAPLLAEELRVCPLAQLEADLAALRADVAAAERLLAAASEGAASEAPPAGDRLVPMVQTLVVDLGCGLATRAAELQAVVAELAGVAALFGERGDTGRGQPDARAGEAALGKLAKVSRRDDEQHFVVASTL